MPMVRKSKQKRSHETKKSRSVVTWVIAVIAICILGFCAYKVIVQLLDYHNSNQMYEKIRSEAVTDNDGDLLSDAEEDVDTTDLIGIDWEAVKDENVVAWLQLDDISYPVYHDDGSLFYLRHLPDGTYATAGSIFLYGENSSDFTDQSSFIYGHNMANGTMFGKLKNYVSDEYASHRFYLYLPDGTRHVYQFFSIATVGESSQAYTWSFADDASFENWQKWMKEMSLMNCTAEIDTTKRYVTLSTCNGASGTTKRLVICGQEVRVDQVQEPASWYNDYAASLSESEAQMHQLGQERADVLAELRLSARQSLYNARRSVDSD